MKNILSAMLLISIFLITACQKETPIELGGVYPYDISLYSQAAVDEFALHKYEGIEGDLVIIGDDITYLDSLYSLKFVRGKIQIGSTSILNTFGLDNITSIALNLSNRSYTNLFIYENSKLVSVNLPQVNQLRGGFTIQDNIDLFGIYMPQIPFAEEGIQLKNNPELTDLNFNALKFIGGTLQLENIGIENLNGFSSVINMQDTTPSSSMTIDAGIHVSKNQNLKNLNGLEGLLRIAGDCIISNNPQLKDINGLSSATAIDHGISMFNNDALEDLEGFRNITSVDAGITIHNNTSLTDLCGLSSCFESATSFDVNFNAYDPSYQDMLGGNCSL